MPTNLITWMKQANLFQGICPGKKTDNPKGYLLRKLNQES